MKLNLNKKSKQTLVVLGIVALVIFGVTQLAVVGAGQFDNCDALSNSFGAWDTTSGNMMVNTTDKQEGTGCIQNTIGTTVAWTSWIYKRPLSGLWDFTGAEVVNAKIKQSVGRFCNVSLSLVTSTGASGWESYDWYIGYLPPNTWTTVTIDMKGTLTEEGLVPDLTKGRQLAWQVNDAYAIFTLPEGSTFQFDDIRLASSTTIPPVTTTISPTTATVIQGNTQVLTASVVGGIAPYTIAWYKDNVLISGATGATYTFTGTIIGTFTFHVVATDNIGASDQSPTATVTVAPIGTQQYTVSISVNGTGATIPSGSNTYNSGTVVTITATPAEGQQFAKFIVNNQDNMNNPLQITVNQNYVIVAYFALNGTVAPTPSPNTTPQPNYPLSDLPSTPINNRSPLGNYPYLASVIIAVLIVGSLVAFKMRRKRATH